MHIKPDPQQGEAKRFFVDKVILQARNEGVPLSAAEIHMLSWSESDPAFVQDPELIGQFASETTEEQYEETIAGLLRRGFEADVAANPDARALWQAMCSRIEQGDHYISVMIGQALEGQFKRWWQFWR